MFHALSLPSLVSGKLDLKQLALRLTSNGRLTSSSLVAQEPSLDFVALIALLLIVVVPGLVWKLGDATSWKQTLTSAQEWNRLRRSSITVTFRLCGCLRWNVEVNARKHKIWRDIRWLPICALLAMLQLALFYAAERSWYLDRPSIENQHVYQLVSHLFSSLALLPLLAFLVYFEAQYRPLRATVDILYKLVMYIAIIGSACIAVVQFFSAINDILSIQWDPAWVTAAKWLLIFIAVSLLVQPVVGVLVMLAVAVIVLGPAACLIAWFVAGAVMVFIVSLWCVCVGLGGMTLLVALNVPGFGACILLLWIVQATIASSETYKTFVMELFGRQQHLPVHDDTHSSRAVRQQPTEQQQQQQPTETTPLLNGKRPAHY